jgi:hypothetical protein
MIRFLVLEFEHADPKRRPQAFVSSAALGMGVGLAFAALLGQ